jgi:hypothetical protein
VKSGQRQSAYDDNEQPITASLFLRVHFSQKSITVIRGPFNDANPQECNGSSAKFVVDLKLRTRREESPRKSDVVVSHGANEVERMMQQEQYQLIKGAEGRTRL